MVWLLPSPITGRGPAHNQIWMFYAGTNMDHNGDVDAFSLRGHQTGIGAALLRLDGFVSLTGPLHPVSGAASSSATWPALAITKPLRFAAATAATTIIAANKSKASSWRLELNVKTGGGGSVRVELRDGKSGEPIHGFGLADCIPMIIDSTNATVLWAKEYHTAPVADLSKLSRLSVQVAFQLVGAELYAFQFVESEAV